MNLTRLRRTLKRRCNNKDNSQTLERYTDNVVELETFRSIQLSLQIRRHTKPHHSKGPDGKLKPSWLPQPDGRGDRVGREADEAAPHFPREAGRPAC